MADKLYWRRDDGSLAEAWHCFIKNTAGGFLSLCGKIQRSHSDGRALTRPAQHLRCSACDGQEMARRGWQESGPAR